MVKVKATRRGVILIEPYKQLRFGLMFLVINLVFSTLLFGIFGYYLWDIYESLSFYFQLDKNQSVMTLAKIGRPAIIGLILIIFFIATTLFMSARYTHQIYGPMVSILRFLDDLLAGKEPSSIKLRSSDQLQELVSKLNLLTKKYANQIQQGDNNSKQKLIDSIDNILEGKKVQELNLPEGDLYSDLAVKINQLAQKLHAP
ncbi:MAG: hypothetical protein AB8G05_14605 [Oligoflexales bacterium]